MNVREIITEQLQRTCYNALYNSEAGCGCSIEELIPCGNLSEECQSAMQIKAKCKTCISPCDGYDENEAVCYTVDFHKVFAQQLINSTKDKTFSPANWCQMTGIVIIDPDGWDRSNYEDFQREISLKEFINKCHFSTTNMAPNYMALSELIN